MRRRVPAFFLEHAQDYSLFAHMDKSSPQVSLRMLLDSYSSLKAPAGLHTGCCLSVWRRWRSVPGHRQIRRRTPWVCTRGACSCALPCTWQPQHAVRNKTPPANPHSSASQPISNLSVVFCLSGNSETWVPVSDGEHWMRPNTLQQVPRDGIACVTTSSSLRLNAQEW